LQNYTFVVFIARWIAQLWFTLLLIIKQIGSGSMNLTKRKSELHFLSPTIIIFTILLGTNVLGQMKNENLKNIAASLQGKLDSITKKRVVPGITLSVRFKDGTNLSLASGLADVEKQIPMKPDAVMFSGSVGKTYVAAVILKLYEQGLVDLQAKASIYLQDEKWFFKVQNANDITVEMLLNHTAGIPDYVYTRKMWRLMRKNPDKEWQVDERLAYIFSKRASNAPGKGWAYSESHYLILGLIIEKVTGKSYYTVLDELILKPCQLTHTFPSNKRTLPGLIPGYTKYTFILLLPHKVLNDNNQYAYNPQHEWTGGGLVSTSSDLSLWVKQLYGGDVLKPETKKRMLTPTPFSTPLFESAKYGLGCFIGETNGITYYGHTGFVPGYITFVQYLPQFDIAFACQFNKDNSHDNISMKTFFNSLKNVVIDACEKPEK
jgi:D-alanyl-D-alanine carboxypeptidase